MTYEEPMDYNSVGTKTIDHDVTVGDICDFIVEYINSDVLVWFNGSGGQETSDMLALPYRDSYQTGY